ncbi:unnamed protein product [Tilletia controversa]|uniref:Uncharacterized protein n=2 Tax=Tilletia TaxID=13289 RepID=A0A177U184_9BASI|nr:hypothetical protein CF336_g6618 [Tilletia laevis]KAE8253280.1 hypothetical protein A4X03_0g5938 [Tilletia caries]CAD6912824.1 unnamed protein product [Tilletia controversa]KAE8191961.1 hypothetical protein CF335_g5954 [Tilletia laevis]CAD6890828.1 unnamed protein product [Tilletia caries]
MSDSDRNKQQDTALLASTAHPQVRDILNDGGLVGTQLGEAMIRVIDVQLKLHAEQDRRYREMVDERDEDIALPVTQPGSEDGQDNVLPTEGGDVQHAPTLFAHAAARVAIELGRASKAEARKIAKRVPLVDSLAFKSAIVNLFVRLPYSVFSQALRYASTAGASQTKDTEGVAGSDGTAATIDEWIIRNEKYMRARLILDQHFDGDSTMSQAEEADVDPSISQLGIDQSESHWKQFMVGLERDATSVFSFGSDTKASSNSTIRIERPDKVELPGLLLLDHHRKDAIEINTLSAFHSRFESMTFGALKGLDWSNVLVAGGIALAALTSITDEEAKTSESSDIDLYLWGLTVDQANDKLQEIEKVFVSNLPLDNGTGKPVKYAVLRNSQTITFIPQRYPYRRVQVVLKLCPNPMSILLNFDLDQVAIGYTGDEVWMLPRASRALVTGYTTFTMDLIHGSFLAPRKATQDGRVFKYAQRGYGLRFLPSYIAALPTVSLKQKTTTEADVPEESLPRDELHVTLREERARVAWWLAQQNAMFKLPFSERIQISMVSVDSRTAISGEVAERSSLSGWQLFVRHVALWEYAQLGYFILNQDRESWVEEAYGEDPLAYQDGPEFRWDADFSLEQLEEAVKSASKLEESKLDCGLNALGVLPDRSYHYRTPKKEFDELVRVDTEKWVNERIPLKRSILASSLREAFLEPLVTMVHLPKNLRAHLESRMQGSPSRFADVTKPGAPCHQNVANWVDAEAAAVIRSDSELVLSYWIYGPDPKRKQEVQGGETGDTVIAPHWQLVSREKDEVYEIVHAFRRAHRDLCIEAGLRNRSVRRQVSRRLVRPTERSERDAFRRWACMRAQEYTGWYGDTEEWAMLRAPRSAVFRRFELTNEEVMGLEDEVIQLDWDEDDEDDDSQAAQPDSYQPPQTVQEWIAGPYTGPQSDNWKLWYRQRIPPAELLPALVAGTSAINREDN